MSTETYIAFDAYGIKDKLNSNWPYLRNLLAWQHSFPERFGFNDLEDMVKLHELGDDPLETRIQKFLIKKIEAADNLLVVSSAQMNVESPILNWQIKQAVQTYRLPVIVAYAGVSALTPGVIEENLCHLPVKLREYMAEGSAKVAHVPLNMDKVERACKFYSRREGHYAWSDKTIF